MTKACFLNPAFAFCYQTSSTVVFQLIRTTYRTRFDQRKRKDDDQPMRAEELELMMTAQRKAIANEIGNFYSTGL
jgi:hypothetical protein